MDARGLADDVAMRWREFAATDRATYGRPAVVGSTGRAPGSGAFGRVPAFGGVAGPAGWLADRFLVWRGASGRAHVFSRYDDVADVAGDALFLIPRIDAAGRIVGARVDTRPEPGRPVWVHFVGDGEGALRRVRMDLAAAPCGPSPLTISERDLPRAA